VKVVTNVPQWMPLGERERARLQGGRRAAHGESAFLGAAVRDVAHNFRIELGPLDAETYRHFLPGEAWVTRLRDWVRQYLGIEYQWSLRVLLQRQDVTGAALGSSGRLGYSAWLGMQPQPLAAVIWFSSGAVIPHVSQALSLTFTESIMSEISRAVLFGKLDTLLFSSLESATAFCKLRGNPYVELVHWLHALMQQDHGDLQQVIRHFALSEEALTKDIVHALDSLPRGASSVSDLSEHIDNAVERAWVYGSLKFGVNRIRGGHLLIGLLKTWSLATVLKRYLVAV
jgi:hypothetical protein